MKKYIVLSVNDNVDYLYFAPLVCWAWRKFGWEPILFYQQSRVDDVVFYGDYSYRDQGKLIIWLKKWYDENHFDKPILKFVDSIEGYRSDTITQISRLYGACVKYGYLMTGDIDMLPLSDYWKPEDDKITVYGHDLTGFGHYPICYIGMESSHWMKVMGIVNNDYNWHIKNDLDTLPQAKNPDFYKYWFSDQDLITERLNQDCRGKITFINRGQGSHGYARGRVDRGSGGWVLNQPELIDAHLEQQTWQNEAKTQRLYELLAHVWPNENFDWFKNYTNEFRKLAV